MRGTLVPLAVLATLAAGAGACRLSLDGKDQCLSADDCLSGYVCSARKCVRAAAPSDAAAEPPDGAPDSSPQAPPREAGMVDLASVGPTQPDAGASPGSDAGESPSSPAQGGYLQVSAGRRHTCVVKADHGVACWGLSTEGQLAVPAGGRFLQVSAGDGHTCALDEKGAALCWGDKSEIGGGPPTTPLARLSNSRHHTCGLTSAGQAFCWGNNNAGQTVVPDGARFRELAVGAEFTCGIKSDGTPVCWGNTGMLHLGTALDLQAISAGPTYACVLGRTGEISCWDDGSVPDLQAPSGIFQNLALGERYAVAQRGDGTLQPWGIVELDGQPLTGTFKQFSMGESHGCGLTTDGHLACWGVNYEGAAGPPVQPLASLAINGDLGCGLTAAGQLRCWNDDFSRPGPYKQVAPGRAHFCAIRANDTLECDGYNDEIGRPPSGTFKQVSTGPHHACAVDTSNKIQCWGQADLKRLEAPRDPMGFTAVACGEINTCAIKKDGSVVCWGDGYPEVNTVPPGPFAEIGVGESPCGRRPDGSVVCWGNTDMGHTSVPKGSFTQISVGGIHACGLQDGKAVCWGGVNYWGERNVAEGEFKAIGAGFRHSCALRPQGNVVCWGSRVWTDDVRPDR